MNKRNWRKKHIHSKLTIEGKKAKNLVDRICEYLSRISGRRFYSHIYCDNNIYECHIIDTGHCIELENGDVRLSNNPNDEEIGSIFFGGHYDRRKFKDADSKAWQSLLMDCIGKSCDIEIRDFHNLTNALKTFGPSVDMNFSCVEDCEKMLHSSKVDQVF